MRAYADNVDDYGRVHTIEIHEDGFVGTAVKLKGNADRGFFSFEHQKIDPREPWGIQKGILDLHVWVQSGTLINDITQSGERDFWLIHKIDDVEQWRGFVLPDLCSFTEDEVPSFQITAKDFTVLTGENFSLLPSGRFTAIRLLSDMLDYLGWERNIVTSTSMTYQGLTGDFFRGVYLNREVFSIPQEAGQAPQEISVLDALEVFARNFGLIIKQANGVFHVDQLTAYSDASDVRRSVYDSDGVLVSEAKVNTISAINRTDRRITLGSTSANNPGIKRATVQFNHRTTVRNISWPPSEQFLTSEFPTLKSQFFQSDGTQNLKLDGEIWARFPEDSGHTEASSVAQITFSNVGATVNYRWNGEEWVISGTPVNLDIPLTRLGTGDQYRGSFVFFTDRMPEQTGSLTVLVTKPISNGTPDEPNLTEFTNFNLDVRNPSVEDGDNTAIDFGLTQAGDFSVVYNHGETWAGDGPTSYAISAITLSEDGTQLTGSQWGRAGEVLDSTFHRLLLREFIDFQRSFRRNVNAILKGAYTPSNTISYDSSTFYYLGGTQDGMTGNWSADFVILNIQTGADSFDINYRTSAIGGIGGGIGGSGGGGGVTATWDSLQGKPFSGIGDNLEVVSDDLRVVNTPSITQVTLADPSTTTDHAVRADRTVSSGNGMTGGGNLTANRTLTLGTPSALTLSTTNQTTADSHTHSLDLSGRTLTLTGGDGISVDLSAQNLGDNRTWTLSADVNDPIYINTGSLDVRNHGLAQRGVITTGTQDIYGRKQFQSEAQFLEDVFQDKGLKWSDDNSFLQTDTFAGGFGGSGLRWNKVSGKWELTTDNLVVRNIARFYELVVERIRSVGGTLIVNEGMKVAEVVQVGDGSELWSSTTVTWDDDVYWGGTWECFTEEDMMIEFTEDDLIKRQEYTGRSIGVTEATVVAIETGSPTPTVNTPRRFFRVWIEPGSDAPTDGSDFVRIGNLTNPDRQNGIIITSSDTGNPYRRIYAGVDSFSRFGDFDTLKLQDGRLDNLIDPSFPDLDGSQTNLFGIWTNGGYFNNVQVRGQITVLPGGNAATGSDVAAGVQESKEYTDSQLVGAAGSVTIRSATAPTERPGGSSLQAGDAWIKTDEGDLPHTWTGSGWERSYVQIGGGNIVAGSLDINRLDFTPLISAGGSNAVVATINATSEGIRITGNRIQLNGDVDVLGSFSVVGENITLDGDTTITGAFTLNGSALVNGSIAANKLTALSATGSQYAGIQAGSGTTRNFFAGATNTSGAGASFYVTAAGSLFASTGTFGGALDAVTGSFGNVSVGGILTMGSGGEITNSGSDFVLDSSGLQLKEVRGFTVDLPRSISFIDTENSNILSGLLYYNNESGDVGGGVPPGKLKLHSTNSRHLDLYASADCFIGSGGNIFINAGTDLYLQGLPTSSPGGTSRVWRDSSGFLRIT